ncbi:hypothetical protein RUM43_003963 [Polyplax serrata]|uniref:Glutathione peroxidase n=1 Tax=Polyplax serrata TaxID=468196 RepID=A0AAN8Q783_POLSC
MDVQHSDMDVTLLASLLLSALTTFLPCANGGDIQRIPSRPCFYPTQKGETIYKFNITDIYDKDKIRMSDYQGIGILIKNYTPSLTCLNALLQSYRDLVVIGVPSNQFGKQEPGSNVTEILNGVKYVRPGGGFIPNFPLCKKSDINGKDELPMYTFLKAYCPTTRDGFDDIREAYWKPVKNNDVKWNWEKFLVTKKGMPYMRYDPSTPPDSLRADIEFLLQNDV